MREWIKQAVAREIYILGDGMEYQNILDFVKKYNIEKRTQEGLSENIENYKKAYPKKYSEYFGSVEIGKLYRQIDNVSLSLGNWPECSYNHIVSRINIRYQGDYVGYYKMVFNFDGTIEDDIFYLE